MTTELYIDRLPSEIGDLLLVSDGASICALDFADYEARLLALLKKRFAAVTLTPCPNPQGFSDRLRAYLEGNLHSFDQVPINPGGTAFQQRVWLGLRQIPAGTVASYAELAAKVGKPTAYRAVGLPTLAASSRAMRAVWGANSGCCTTKASTFTRAQGPYRASCRWGCRRCQTWGFVDFPDSSEENTAMPFLRGAQTTRAWAAQPGIIGMLVSFAFP